ncbi:hypothetical protein H9623_00715 [Oerskovia sp. Sa1BUA8]|uniref:Uncharacterized protein n=1 Tax=Oerskovia douganii TaxID=2762210 RepID=A0A9D5YXE8_9CELL|nr:hypothetical protein [Oerskovia douganii]MBE7698827.1 hypothetical protein [Oerskovia douganii]
MEHRRRALDVGPGEHLLLPASALDTMGRLHLWRAFTGLHDGELLLSPLTASPLPMPWTVPAGHRRWPGLRPAALWHPLLWLPARLRSPSTLHDPTTGRTWGETYDEWATRVVLEMTESGPVVIDGERWVLLHDPHRGRHVRPLGPSDEHLVPLYDPTTGTWLDVLATVGLDVDRPDDLARVGRWLAGEDDEALDAVDLDRFLHAADRDPTWALDRTQRVLVEGGGHRTYVEDLRDASCALVARELDDRATDLASARLSARDLGQRVGALARAASTLLTARSDVAEDLGLSLGLVTARAERATTVDAASAAVADLRALLGSAADAAAIGLDRIELRVQVETTEVLGQIADLARAADAAEASRDTAVGAVGAVADAMA